MDNSIIYQHYYPIFNVSFVFTNVNGVFVVFTKTLMLVLTTPARWLPGIGEESFQRQGMMKHDEARG